MILFRIFYVRKADISIFNETSHREFLVIQLLSSFLLFRRWYQRIQKWTKRTYKPKELTINADAARRRQAVIDKAINKRSVLIKILKELVKKNNISKTLIYCPRGTDETTGEKIIHLIGQYVNRNFKKNKFNDLFFKEDTKDRELLLEDFEKGKVDILYAIKCLDEGVDVKSKNAIFSQR